MNLKKLEGILNILEHARDQAMVDMIKTNPPECGMFGGIAQDLDYVSTELNRMLPQLHEMAKNSSRYTWIIKECSSTSPLAMMVWKKDYQRHSSEWVDVTDPASLDKLIDEQLGK